ncbi:MAG TPA: hypothetical protein VKV29_02355 [Chthonomonas sp.]|jgi:hypothetical protein|uniref:hypothetical protein n=1 Tax=Chthonomonas sp. TaxID=2282153 RepID=UPI002B4ACA51|nr:hypothetical protein [Chthonomonas sp.]HLH79107.1 hypothetical protein [Chthonomonas sp.]
MPKEQQELSAFRLRTEKRSSISEKLPVLSEASEAVVIERRGSARDTVKQMLVATPIEPRSTTLQDTSPMLSAGTSSEIEWDGIMEWAQERAARHYVLERCKKHVYIECGEVARLTGWPGPRVRRFILEVQDEWRQIQGIRPRGRPRKSL